MVTSGVILAAAAALLPIRGLHVPDLPADRLAEDAGVLGTLGTELTNARGIRFNVTREGEYVMIGLPLHADVSRPEQADLLVAATYAQVGSGCDDLLIRKITVEGRALGNNLSKLEFFVANDVFNDTDAIGLTATDHRGVPQTYDVQELSAVVPDWQVFIPQGQIHQPTRKSWRQRTTMYHGTLSLDDGRHQVDIFWATVWRGMDKTDGAAVHKNDLAFTVSGVYDLPAGLLGTSDHSEATLAVPGCPKPWLGGDQQHGKRHHLFR